MKIVLVRPNYNSHIITPPLGIGYLASYLKANGIEAVIIDGLRDGLSQEIVLTKIMEEKPDAVGITCLTAFYHEVVNLSKEIKARGIKCIIGGVHPTILPYQTLIDSEADYVVCGEAEIALLKLMQNNCVNNQIQGVYSLANLHSENDAFSKAQIVENLDEIPFPDWEQINPNSYPRAPHGALVKNFPIGIITSTRGCPYECTFCASPQFYGRRIRFRSPENVVAEISHLVKNFGIKEIHFEDDNFTLRRDHVIAICNLIKKENLQISWACPNGIRADSIDKELVEIMAKNGCYYFAYGIESANPQILQNIKKRESVDVIKKAIAIAHNAGISCQGFFIFGLPGETPETIKESIKFAKKSKLSRAQFLILDVLPGSELWNTLGGKFVPNWEKNSYKEPEWLPEGLTKKDLEKAQSRAFRKFYLRPSIFFRLLMLIDEQQIKFLFKRLEEYRIVK